MQTFAAQNLKTAGNYCTHCLHGHVVFYSLLCRFFPIDATSQAYCYTVTFPWQLFRWTYHSLRPAVQTFTGRTYQSTSIETNLPHFLHIPNVTLWKRLLRGCFPEHYNFNLFKSRVNHYLLSLSSLPITYFTCVTPHNFNNNPLQWLALVCIV